MDLTLRFAMDGEEEKWDEINTSSSTGTIFHTWKWLKITEKHTNTKLYPLIGMQGSTIIGLFPLFFQKKGPIRTVFSPPPRAALFYLGPVIVGYDTLKQAKREILYNEFLNSVENFIQSNLKANYCNISLSPGLQDPRPFSWSGYTVEPNYDYVVDLSIGPDRLLRSLDKSGRQNLNRARKRGITMEIGGKKEYEAILDLMEIRYAQQSKILTASRYYYLDIYNTYKDNLKILVVKINGKVVTGSIDIHYKDTIYSWIGNPKSKNIISPSPNDLIIWESIRYGYENGFRYYVTMSAAENKRLHSYYSSKCDPTLQVRFTVKKNSFFTRTLEKVYTDIIKSQKGKTKWLHRQNVAENLDSNHGSV